MRTCVITGASSGIGRASAIMLSQTRDYDNYTLIGRNIKGFRKRERQTKEILRKRERQTQEMIEKRREKSDDS